MIRKSLQILWASLILISFLNISDVYEAKDRRWFRYEVKHSDWRGCGELDYSTNAPVAWYYEPNFRPKYLRQENMKEFYQRLAKGDTLRVGIDYYGNFPITRSLNIFPNSFYNQNFYLRTFWNMGVIKLKMWANGDKIFMREYEAHN